MSKALVAVPLPPKGRPPTDPVKRKAYDEKKKAWEEYRKHNLSIVKDEEDIVEEDDPAETEEDIVKKIEKRFYILYKCAKGAANGVIRSLIVSGRGGVGKTYTIEEVLEHAKEHKNVKYEIVRGVLSPVNLYKLLWRNRAPNCVTVLDDADGIFDDEDALSILKAALDSGSSRKISWFSETATLKAEGIDNQFLYEGTMIFITNLNFQARVDAGKGKNVSHMQALMTRASYLDLKLHTQRELVAWVCHLVRKKGILIQEGLTKEQQEEVLMFIREHTKDLRELSLRTPKKIAGYVKMEGAGWKTMAEELELR